MGNNFSSKYELFRNVKADDKKGLNKNYGIFLVLRRKTGMTTCPCSGVKVHIGVAANELYSDSQGLHREKSAEAIVDESRRGEQCSGHKNRG